MTVKVTCVSLPQNNGFIWGMELNLRYTGFIRMVRLNTLFSKFTRRIAVNTSNTTLLFYLCSMSIQELEDFFKSRELPAEISTHPAIKIVDVPKFIDTQLIQIRANGLKTPAYDRLIELKEWFLGKENQGEMGSDS